MKKILNFPVYLSILLTISANCFASHNYEALKSAGEKYLNFLNTVGQSDNSKANKQLPLVIAPRCQKIINGKIVAKDTDQLKIQLQDVHKMVGTWTIESLDTIASPLDQACVVRYVLKSSQKGNYTTMAILRYDEQGRVKEINEIWNMFEG